MEILIFGLLCFIYAELQKEELWKIIWWITGFIFLILGNIGLVAKLLNYL